MENSVPLGFLPSAQKKHLGVSPCTLESSSRDSLRHLAFPSSPAGLPGRDEPCCTKRGLSAADPHRERKEAIPPAFCDPSHSPRAGRGPRHLPSGQVWRVFPSFLFLCPIHSPWASSLSSLRPGPSGRVLSPWERSGGASCPVSQPFPVLFEARVSMASV